MLLLVPQRIEDEVATKRHRMEYLDQAAVYLMQKADSTEAVKVQRELEDFRVLSRRVLQRVNMTQMAQVFVCVGFHKEMCYFALKYDDSNM